MLNIKTIADGSPISAPGIYRMRMDHYHTQLCPGPSVSSTGIRKAVLSSPYAFWMTWDGNPDRFPQTDPSDALIFGRAAHALILGDEVFEEVFAVVPDDAPRRPTAVQVAAFERNGGWSDAAREGALFWEDFDARAEGKTLITASQIDTISCMAGTLRSDQIARDAIETSLMELSLIWQDEATGLWLKSRPDMLRQGADCAIVDLKTFAPRSPDLLHAATQSVRAYGYDMQLALAFEGAKVLGLDPAPLARLTFVSNVEPYEVVHVDLDDDVMHWAGRFVRLGLDRIAHGIKTGDWPMPGDGAPIRYQFPQYLIDRIEPTDIITEAAE